MMSTTFEDKVLINMIRESPHPLSRGPTPPRHLEIHC